MNPYTKKRKSRPKKESEKNSNPAPNKEFKALEEAYNNLFDQHNLKQEEDIPFKPDEIEAEEEDAPIFQPFDVGTPPELKLIPQPKKRGRGRPRKNKAAKSAQKTLSDKDLNGDSQFFSPCSLLFQEPEFVELFDNDVDFKPKKEPPKVTEDVLTLTVCTWNLEKFCQESDQADNKILLLLKMLDLYYPDFLVIQEVTDAPLLETKSLDTPVITGKNFNYNLRDDYGVCYSPLFKAASYQERYVLFYRKLAVEGEPKLTLLYPNGTKLRAASPKDTISFSTKQRKPRPMPVWKCNVPLYRIGISGTQEVLLGGVHTSPSYVNYQATGFVCAADQFAEDTPFIMSGDWYIQKGAKTLWGFLKNREGQWQLIAPEKMTNFKVTDKKKGTIGGQTADHHVVSDQFHVNYQPLTISSQPMHSLDQHHESEHTNQMLGKLLEIDVDHAPVLAILELKYPRNQEEDEEDEEDI